MNQYKIELRKREENIRNVYVISYYGSSIWGPLKERQSDIWYWIIYWLIYDSYGDGNNAMSEANDRGERSEPYPQLETGYDDIFPKN